MEDYLVLSNNFLYFKELFLWTMLYVIKNKMLQNLSIIL
jgi:hypothetical protein